MKESTYHSISVFKTLFKRRKFQIFAKAKFGKPLLCSEKELQKTDEVIKIDNLSKKGEITENFQLNTDDI